VEACDKKCIDLNAKDKYEKIEVGSIIVATGLGVYDPTKLTEYGYGRFENVITTMEFERLICGGGPTDGHLVRPSDHTTPKRIGFVQCVGWKKSVLRSLLMKSSLPARCPLNSALPKVRLLNERQQSIFNLDL